MRTLRSKEDLLKTAKKKLRMVPINLLMRPQNLPNENYTIFRFNVIQYPYIPRNFYGKLRIAAFIPPNIYLYTSMDLSLITLIFQELTSLTYH